MVTLGFCDDRPGVIEDQQACARRALIQRSNVSGHMGRE
jgi:hypothetical protein